MFYNSADKVSSPLLAAVGRPTAGIPRRAPAPLPTGPRPGTNPVAGIMANVTRAEIRARVSDQVRRNQGQHLSAGAFDLPDGRQDYRLAAPVMPISPEIVRAKNGLSRKIVEKTRLSVYDVVPHSAQSALAKQLNYTPQVSLGGAVFDMKGNPGDTGLSAGTFGVLTGGLVLATLPPALTMGLKMTAEAAENMYLKAQAAGQPVPSAAVMDAIGKDPMNMVLASRLGLNDEQIESAQTVAKVVTAAVAVVTAAGALGYLGGAASTGTAAAPAAVAGAGVTTTGVTAAVGTAGTAAAVYKQLVPGESAPAAAGPTNAEMNLPATAPTGDAPAVAGPTNAEMGIAPQVSLWDQATNFLTGVSDSVVSAVTKVGGPALAPINAARQIAGLNPLTLSDLNSKTAQLQSQRKAAGLPPLSDTEAATMVVNAEIIGAKVEAQTATKTAAANAIIAGTDLTKRALAGQTPPSATGSGVAPALPGTPGVVDQFIQPIKAAFGSIPKGAGPIAAALVAILAITWMTAPKGLPGRRN